MKVLDIAEVIERFDEVLDAVEQGATISVARNGSKVARLLPVAPAEAAQLQANKSAGGDI